MGQLMEGDLLSVNPPPPLARRPLRSVRVEPACTALGSPACGRFACWLPRTSPAGQRGDCVRPEVTAFPAAIPTQLRPLTRHMPTHRPSVSKSPDVYVGDGRPAEHELERPVYGPVPCWAAHPV